MVKLLLEHGADVNATDRVSLKNTSYLTFAPDSSSVLFFSVVSCTKRYCICPIKVSLLLTLIHPNQKYICNNSPFP